MSPPPDFPFALLFALLSLALLALPFVPTWREWRKPTDCAPLPIPRADQDEVDAFADLAREALTAPPPPAGNAFAPAPATTALTAWARAHRPLLAREPLHFDAAVQCSMPVFACGSIEATDAASFTAVYTLDSLQLGPGSEISRWAHAGKALHLGASSVALQSLSADRCIALERDCCFQRLRAPAIRFGEIPSRRLALRQVQLVEGDLSSLPHAVRRTDALYRVDGNCELPAGHRFHGSLVVIGWLVVGENTTIDGDVKAHKGIVLRAGARVTGSLVCEQGIRLMDFAWAGGPVISEADVLLDACAIVGRPDTPTTVSAEHVIAETGSRAHGTVWARQAGVVWTTEALP